MIIRPLIFAPCEQVLQSDGMVFSIISVLENVTVGGGLAGALPANAGLPKKWSVVILWTRNREVTKPTTHMVKVDLHTPDGTPTMGGEVEFIVSNEHQSYRNTVNFDFFPIGQAGECELKLQLKSEADPEYAYIASYPIRIMHDFQELPSLDVTPVAKVENVPSADKPQLSEIE